MKKNERIVTTQHYLITFKYPIIAKYECYECPGAYYIDWKTCRLFKTHLTKKTITLDEQQLLFEEMYKSTAHFYNIYNKILLDKYHLNSEFYG